MAGRSLPFKSSSVSNVRLLMPLETEMFDLPRMPKMAPEGFLYLTITEVDKGVLVFVTGQPIGLACNILIQEENVSRMWVSPLSPSASSDAQRLAEEMKKRNIPVEGNLFRMATFEEMTSYAKTHLTWFGFGEVFENAPADTNAHAKDANAHDANAREV